MLGLTAASSAATAADKITVAGVYTAPIEQQWINRIHEALSAAEARGDIEYTFSENVAQVDAQRVQREYANRGVDLVVGDSFHDERGFRRLAEDYPETDFLMGSSFPPQGQNFSVFDNFIQECSYLTGMIAGGLTETNTIGLIGGFAIPEVNRLMHGFMAGVREVNPDVRFIVNFIDSWYDPPKAKESAFAMMDAGADIMYAERFGVSDAAEERGALAIGNVIDTQHQYPDTVVASAIWNFEPTADAAIARVRDGTFTGEDYGKLSHLAHGGCELAPLGTFKGKVPDDLMARVNERAGQIKSGEFTVEVDDSEPRSN
ncbi:BMP family protein [Nitratireductor sp. XY-223]|uniref:BMP family protein n=1 Tax=Nitratireductor sp. XY-223 TaxID=2561926 RepID=UPI001FEEB0A7|nr:BMP family protein [Nitratireductor sp. XY-223]